MCGIVGYITLDDKTRTLSKDKFLTEALYMDALRGFHSTGIMTLHEDYMWQYQKQAVDGAEFIQRKGYKERTKETWCAVGHNRHATTGAVTTDNAHPFKQGDITLVHNGTLRSEWNLEANAKIEVDSELIAYNLSIVEPAEAPDVIGKLVGAYTLVWFDSRDESVNMVRNSERPLHLGLNRSEDILYFMSEGYMLNCLTERLLDSTAKPVAIWKLAAGQILKYKKGNMVPEVARVVPFTRAIPESEWPLGGSRHRGAGSADTTSTGKTTPIGGSSTSKFPVRTEINGKIRKVPEAHLSMVEDWYHLNPQKGQCFRPMKFVPYDLTKWGERTADGDLGRMIGRMHHPSWFVWYDCVIHNVTRSQAVSYKADWTVVVCGLDHTTHGLTGDKTCIIARGQWFSWDGGTVMTEDDLDSVKDDGPGPPWHPQKTLEAMDMTTLVEGPHGMITEEAFEKLTQDGCTMCMAPIDIDDSLTISWVGEMQNQPLCYGCLDWTTQGGLNDYTHD